MTKQKAEVKQKTDALLVGGVSQSQLDSWKAKHGKDNIRIIEVDLDTEGKRKVSGYFRKPDLNAIAAAASVTHDPIKSGMILFDACYLGGDPEVTSDEEVKFAAMLQLNKMFQRKAARIKKRLSASEIVRTTGLDEIRKGSALVRKFFSVDPYSLTEEEFVRLVSEAVWLVHYEQELKVSSVELGVMKAISKLFSK